MTAVITGVSFPADGRPVVKHQGQRAPRPGRQEPVHDRGDLAVLAAQARPGRHGTAPGVNGSANDTWVSYLAANDHSSASSETAAAANLTDHGDGSYDYRFAKVINGGAATAGTTYEADKTHRLIVLLYASGNPFSPINLVKDLVPATGADVTGQHETVDGNACLECHTSFRAITRRHRRSSARASSTTASATTSAPASPATTISAASAARGAPVAEPTIAADGTWTGNAAVLNREAVLNLPVFIHKIHMGNKLKMTGGSYAGFPQPYETTYPQDVRNCAKCHRAPAPLADHWKTQPSSRACGACHDDRSFEATLPARPHRAQRRAAGDRRRLQHLPPGGQRRRGHRRQAHARCPRPTRTTSTPTPRPATATPTPPTSRRRAPSRRAPRWSPTSSRASRRGPTPPPATCCGRRSSFKFKLDGNDVVFPDPATASELIPGFVGSPSAYFVFAVPQDGKAAPADFNASASAYIKNIWNGTGTCSNAAVDHHAHRRGHAHRAGRERLLHAPPHLRDDPRERDDADRRHRLHLRARIAPEPAQPGSRLRQQHAAAHADQPARLSLRRQQEGGRRHARLRRRGRAHRAAARRVDGRHRLHRPARHRRQQQVRRAATSRWASGPTSTPASATTPATCNWCHRPNQTSSAWSANAEGLRPRHPRRGEAHDAVHLARGVAHGGLLEDDLPRRAQQVRDVPPARDLRLQHRARRRPRTRTCSPAPWVRGRTRPAACTRPT